MIYKCECGHDEADHEESTGPCEHEDGCLCPEVWLDEPSWAAKCEELGI